MRWKLFVLFAIYIPVSIFTTLKLVPDYFNYITEVNIDNSGYIHYINNLNDQVNIVKTDSNGTILNTIDFKTIKGNRLYEYSDMAIDSEGNIYVVEIEYETFSHLIISEKILKFDKNGEFQKEIYSISYDDAKRRLNIGISSVDIYEDFIYFFHLNEDKSFVKLKRISINGHTTDTIKEMVLSQEIYPSELRYSPSGDIILLTRKANIIKLDKQGSYTHIFPHEGFSENSIPSDLSIDANGNLFFMDLFTGNKVFIDMNEKKAIVKNNSSDIIEEKTGLTYKDIRNLYAYNENLFAAITNDVIDDKKSIAYMEENTNQVIYPSLPHSYYIIRIVTLYILLSLATLILILFYKLFRRFVSKRSSIIFKQAIILMPLILISMIIVNIYTMNIYQQVLYDETISQVYNFSLGFSRNIDAEKVKAIDSPKAYKGTEYNELDEILNFDLDSYYDIREEEYKKMIYNMLSVVRDDRFYIGVSYSYQCNMPMEYIYNRKSLDLYKKAANEKRIISGSIQDELGTWLVVVTPIIDSNGTVVGVLETGTTFDDYNATVVYNTYKISIVNLFSAFIIIILCMIALYISLKPLRKLKHGVDSISQGNYGTQIKITSNDEITDISKVFNQMSGKLQKHFNELTKLNDAYYRFVPLKFFELLHKKSVLHVKLGNQVKKDITIMFTNTQDFDQISSKLSTEEIFNLINSAFNLIGNEITNLGGIVDRFDRAGVLSLFPVNPEKALTSSIALREKLLAQKNLNSNDNLDSLDFASAIHKGSVMLGIVGQENRMSATAISEHVNLVFRIETLSKELGCSILVTEPVYKSLPANKYNSRHIGRIVLKERNEIINLYDFYDGDQPELLMLKKRTKIIFEESVKLFLQSKFYEARNGFINVLKINPYDSVSKKYIYKCDEYYKKDSVEKPDLSLNTF
ncbi:adenylate/guanylate cyclase domain-containing protein [Herbivorax sp. ANBcel31]|uniref:HAMP domain-containing protein n=1 Tax=Herbivorax sp. ANBcel31 TaxID=3069754 RepID=UPI0027B4BB05|nr:adenylate/guanylate cyclase domain-containing protein [Herbivorax sp. ANBcel31]MDQ2085358.1 adenylate/guanylate cyclase domain-containing protein [Herbivorax sp. ANBcel31]